LFLSFSPAHRAWFEANIYDPSVIETLFALGPIIVNVFIPFVFSVRFGWERVNRVTCNCYPPEIDGHEMDDDDEYTTAIDMTARQSGDMNEEQQHNTLHAISETDVNGDENPFAD
jgi:hypothetical protein